MFKKVEIWVLYLVLLLSILFALAFGVLVRQELVGTKFGWMSKIALTLAEFPANFKASLVGDLKLKDRFPLLDGFDGVVNDNQAYLLLSKYDGDLSEGVVELIDLKTFEVLHTWNPDVDSFNMQLDDVDDFKFIQRDNNNSRAQLKRPNLNKDGHLLYNLQSGNGPLVKIDQCSNLILQVTNNAYHHSIEIDSSGDVWAPSYIYPQTLPSNKIGRKPKWEKGFSDDGITKLSSDGKILFSKSVSQIFIDHDMEYLLFSHGNDYERDPIHLNDIQPVNYDTKYWKKGDIFLSIRNQSMIVLYRPKTNEIIWTGVGPFLHQHDVDIIDDHRISVFNNRSINIVGDTNIVDGNNEVVIYDFRNNEFTSYLKDSLAENKVRTTTQGLSEILPNGDMFVEETDAGRSLYFNKDGSLRWTHVNRAKNRNIYRVGWSRILYTKNDIDNVNNFLSTKGNCNE